ncbi:zinc-ribbon domain-containing protein [Thermogemmatispora carboxidivorans]|uniref:zinc-ribbon domain-containing protein n=1 Tax=Thermogemmatispora carboxidivorans TaxID=1382306 RepID=UPI0006997908|nr:zinc-ribbon domain-containing protein [Thermogemmatispora carboxidivorans]
MYVIVYGYRTKQWRMGQISAPCQRCQRTVQQQVVRSQRKFTLFWIPLFPIGTKTFLVCPFCGNQARIDNKQADAWFRQPAPPGTPGMPGVPPQPGQAQQPGQ